MDRNVLYLAFYQGLVFAIRVFSCLALAFIYTFALDWFQVALSFVIIFNYSHTVNLQRVQETFAPKNFFLSLS
jgi:hypothetical protein